MSMMSLQSRRELIISVRSKYKKSDWQSKCRILDGFVAATGYQRKYAINLLNHSTIAAGQPHSKRPGRQPVYTAKVQEALITVWKIMNQICAKRLIPFMPDIIESLERHGHLSLPYDVRNKLLRMSVATADRL